LKTRVTGREETILCIKGNQRNENAETESGLPCWSGKGELSGTWSLK